MSKVDGMISEASQGVVLGSLMLLSLGVVFVGGWLMGGTPLSGLFAIAGALVGALIYAGIDKITRNRRNP